MLKRFASYYKPQWKLFSLDLLAALTVATIDLIYPMFTRLIIDDYIPKGRVSLMFKIGLVVLLLYFIRMACNWFMLTFGHLVGGRIEYNMRKDLFGHMQTLDISFYDKNKTGKLMSHLMNDLNEISELAHHGPEDLFISGILLIGSFFILLSIHIKLTLLTFIFVVLLLLVMLFMRGRMNKASHEVRQVQADMNAGLENALSGVRLTKSFTNEPYEATRFDDANKSHLSRRFNFFKAMGNFHATTHLIVDVMSLFILVVGGYFVYLKQIGVGDLVAYILYSTYFIIPIRRLIDFTQQFTTGMTGFQRMQEILSIKPNIEDKEGASDLKDVKGHVAFNDVRFHYSKDGADVLQSFNLEIKPGQHIALVGPSGVGKTTVSKLLPRFYDVVSGSITIDGKDIRDLTLTSIRENIGLVDQDVFIYYGTIFDNILYGRLSATKEDVIEAAKKANIHDFIMSLPENYDTIVGERGVKLSGGQKQRLAIARIFLKDPKILILDEATSALDNETEKAVQKALQKLSVGRTTLTIAHRLSTIINSDEIVVLGTEGILERGTHKELLSRDGEYKRLYEAQFVVEE